MKTALQPAEHLGTFERMQLVEDLWDDFADDSGPERRPEVLEELARRAFDHPLGLCRTIGP